jgi:hypothetical protein
MRVELTPTHDVHNFYVRYEIIPEGKERALLEGLGGPLSLEMEVSSWVDFGGNEFPETKVKIPIWPHAGPKNRGQARFHDVDARRRFMVNLQDAVGTKVVDYLWDAKPGSVGKEGVLLPVPEGIIRASAPTPAAASGSAPTP